MTKTEILELMRSLRAACCQANTHTVLDSDRLVDLGASSADRAEIALLVQYSLGLRVSRIELLAPNNIGELADLFSHDASVGV